MLQMDFATLFQSELETVSLAKHIADMNPESRVPSRAPKGPNMVFLIEYWIFWAREGFRRVQK